MTRRILASLLLVGVLSASALAAPGRDDGSRVGGFFHRFVSKIIHILEDIRMGPPLP